eukprot:9486034-Pyramimonas_sp.AAC.4
MGLHQLRQWDSRQSRHGNLETERPDPSVLWSQAPRLHEGPPPSPPAPPLRPSTFSSVPSLPLVLLLLCLNPIPLPLLPPLLHLLLLLVRPLPRPTQQELISLVNGRSGPGRPAAQQQQTALQTNLFIQRMLTQEDWDCLRSTTRLARYHCSVPW